MTETQYKKLTIGALMETGISIKEFLPKMDGLPEINLDWDKLLLLSKHLIAKGEPLSKDSSILEAINAYGDIVQSGFL